MRLHHSHHHRHQQNIFATNSIFEIPSQNLKYICHSHFSPDKKRMLRGTKIHKSIPKERQKENKPKPLICTRAPVFRRSLNIVKGTTDPGVDCFNQ